MATSPLRSVIERLRFGSSSSRPPEAADDAASLNEATADEALPGEMTPQGVEQEAPEGSVSQDQEPGAQQPPASPASEDGELIHVTPPVFEELNLEAYGEQRQRSKQRNETRRQERKMSDRLSCSAAGITEVILGNLAEDAKVRSSEEVTEIVVNVKSEGPGAPELVVEGDKVRLHGGLAARVEVPVGVAVTADEARGDLKVPQFGGDLRIRNVFGDLRIDNVTGRVDIVHIYGDVRAEAVAEMRVTECDADFRFSGGDLQLESVSGDMRVTDAGSVQGLHVHGDLWIERLSGGLHFESAHGDVRLNDIEGPAALGTVAGDFRATNVRGALNAGQVHGDAQLEGPFPAADGYAVSASGDVHIRLMAEDDVRLVVRAMGRVRSNLPLTPSADGSTTYTASVGEGRVRVTVTANGDLRIEAAAGGREDVRGPWERRKGSEGDPFADLSGLGERIRQQVSASLAAAGINPETGEMNFGPAQVRWGRGRTPEPPRPPKPPKAGSGAQAAPQGSGPMSNEQMSVLKMLEEGRISPEEADSLLRALGA